MNDEQWFQYVKAKAWQEGRDSVQVAAHDAYIYSTPNPYRDGAVGQERYYDGKWVDIGTMEKENQDRRKAEDERLREALKSKKWKARNRNARR